MTNIEVEQILSDYYMGWNAQDIAAQRGWNIDEVKRIIIRDTISPEEERMDDFLDQYFEYWR